MGDLGEIKIINNNPRKDKDNGVRPNPNRKIDYDKVIIGGKYVLRKDNK